MLLPIIYFAAVIFFILFVSFGGKNDNVPAKFEDHDINSYH